MIRGKDKAGVTSAAVAGFIWHVSLFIPGLVPYVRR
jgi:hypothetical protein